MIGLLRIVSLGAARNRDTESVELHDGTGRNKINGVRPELIVHNE